MTILRKIPTDRFVTVRNDVARDQRLSFRARGVLVYLLSLPQDSPVSAERLAAAGTEGRDAIQRALKELADFGYYRVVRTNAGRGRFQMVTEVASEPQTGWLTDNGKPGSGGPTPDNPPPSTKDKDQYEVLAEGQSRTDDQGSVGLFAVPDPAEGPPAPSRPRRADPLFDAIIEVCDMDLTGLTVTARALIGKTRRELADVGATPEQVKERAEEYHARFRGATLTPTALLKHWPSLTPPPPVRELWLR